MYWIAPTTMKIITTVTTPIEAILKINTIVSIMAVGSLGLHPHSKKVSV
jgi:hypothetical protein